MVDDPTVSVIMPTYDEVETVEESVRSILDQTYGDFEFLVVDGGSTDGTVDRVTEFADHRLRLIRQTGSGGISRALNRGIEESSGEYVARMDADDRSSPDRFERQVAVLESFTDVKLVTSWYRTIDRGGDPIAVHRIDPDRNFDIDHIVDHDQEFAHGSVMMRREILETVGGYRPEFDSAEDLDLWLRIAERFGDAAFYVVPDVLYEHRLSADQLVRHIRHRDVSAGAKEAARRRQRGKREPVDAVDGATGSEPGEQFSESRREAMYHYLIGLSYLQSGDTSSARAQFLRAARECPTAVRPWYMLGLSVLPENRRKHVRRLVEELVTSFDRR